MIIKDEPRVWRVFWTLFLLAGQPAIAAEPEAEKATGGSGAGEQVGCHAGVAIQVLGSGGPQLDGRRASAGYLIWVDGRSRVLIDAGGGVYLRFSQAGARLEDLDVVALSHLHIDHSVDFIALLKAGYFSRRVAALPVIGPDGGGDFPGLGEWLRDELAPGRGAYRYLSGYLNGSDDLFPLEWHEVDVSDETPTVVFRSNDLELRAVGVKHGSVPALGFLATLRGVRIAFSGDQNGHNPAFARMIEGADMLIMDHAVPENTNPVAAALHARPSEIARLAQAANVGRLILSHLMPRSERVLSQSLQIISKTYKRPVQVAHDLQCLALR
jgi:ribonuclease BN (tRNA processing enzyme)